MDLNDYNVLSEQYQKSDTKPDKLYSTLPTVLSLLGDITDKQVLDLGCGSGFFTRELAIKGAKKVYGIENSLEQILLAKKYGGENIEYIEGDIFSITFPKVDIVLAPYVLNYSQNIFELKKLIQKIFDSLHFGGVFVAIVDLPEGKNLKKIGAIKNILGEKKDESKIEIQLFNNNEAICTLHSVYYSPKTFENAFLEVGFTNVSWKAAIISEAGIQKYGKDFWEGYIEFPELGYISGIKK